MIYLDHHATTPVDPRVLEAMLPWFDARVRQRGESHARVRLARRSGGRGRPRADRRGDRRARPARDRLHQRRHREQQPRAARRRAAPAARAAITSSTQRHRAQLRARTLRGARARGLRGDACCRSIATGASIPPRVAAAIDDAHAAGLGRLGERRDRHRAADRRDRARRVARAACCCTATPRRRVGKVPVDVAAGVDLLSISAHKLYGPKGVGALWIRSGRPRVRIEPLLFGGGHENGLRPGTLPVPLIVGFGRAVEIAVAERASRSRAPARPARTAPRAPARSATGRRAARTIRSERLPGNLNLGFEGIEADALLAALRDVALSTGSACSSARRAESRARRPRLARRRGAPLRPHRPRSRHHGRADRRRRGSASSPRSARCAQRRRAQLRSAPGA